VHYSLIGSSPTYNIEFEGVAAGSINTSNKTFSGTAAGRITSATTP
jgi:hypothetical protein